jgi:hypothetical protein
MSVPSPGVDSMLKSSISLFTPGSPAPNPPDVENPSSITFLKSEMPGPSSTAIILSPRLVFPLNRSIQIFPWPAYRYILRANSDRSRDSSLVYCAKP